MSKLLSLVIILTVNIMLSVDMVEAKTAKEFQKLLNENRLFDLQKAFKANSSSLEKWQQLYFQAHIDNAFGRNEESNSTIEEIFKKYSSNFNHNQLVSLLTRQSDNFTKQFNYKGAAQALQISLDKYGKSLGKKNRDSYQNVITMYSAIADVPSQRSNHIGMVEIPITVNKFSHWTIPVKSLKNGDTIHQFVFDTGANYSTIRKSIAEELGAIIMTHDISVANSVGGKVLANIGYLPHIAISGVEMWNVIVLILPDEMLTFEQVGYTIDGIIGFPVIRSFGEFSISQDKVLKISAEPTIPAEQNLFTSGLTPYVQVEFNGEALTMICDTGAISSYLSRRYYSQHRAYINQKSNKKQSTIGGAGEMKDAVHRELLDVKLTIALQEFQLPILRVFPKNIFKAEPNDGFLGQDILLKAKEVVMNLEKMYLFFRD